MYIPKIKLVVTLLSIEFYGVNHFCQDIIESKMSVT